VPLEPPVLVGSDPASLEKQLIRFAEDVGVLYRRERYRAEELEQALDQLRVQ
jgi:hypothetical protein